MDDSGLPLFDRLADEEAAREAASTEDQGEGRIHRVAEVNRAVRLMLEDGFGEVWIEGELSNVTRAVSGHVYFTLNDDREPAQLRGVLFRSDAQRAKAKLENGAVVRMRGSLSLYEPRGSFQLIAKLAVPAREQGDLAAEFERIRKKLEREGLFDPARKRALPRLPRVVGVVTSKTGAALQDIIRVASERCPVRIVVADCRVQGQGAVTSIVAAIAAIQRLEELDVLIVARGGGSAEDLWAFNDESVARAIASSRVPTVSGVGHEVDVTIGDLVADVRAATPSNATEIVVPDRTALIAMMEGLERHLEQAMDTRIGRCRLALERLRRGATDPRHRLHRSQRALHAARDRLVRAYRHALARRQATLVDVRGRLLHHDPRARLRRNRQRLGQWDAGLRAVGPALLVRSRRSLAVRDAALGAAMTPFMLSRQKRFAQLTASLEALSPLAVLSRGYAIALHEPTGRALMRARDARVGDRLNLRLHDGSLAVRVEGSADAEASAESETARTAFGATSPASNRGSAANRVSHARTEEER